MQDPYEAPAPAAENQPSPPPAQSGSENQPNTEAMPSPQALLKQAELAAEEHRDAWLRAKADADNIRKRAQADIANAHKYAIENFSTELLAVKDSLEAALAASTVTVDSLRSGVELTLKQLNSVFEKFRVTEINPLGQKFDPHRQQAINTVESDAEPNTVVQVFQKGYLLNDRVIRPAMVAVARAKTD
jgi:molecular chaperone GrpE